jgi:hypothetical protein
VPHLIVSYDTEKQGCRLSTPTIRRRCQEPTRRRRPQTPRIGEKIWRFAAICPHSACYVGLVAADQNGGGEFGGLALSLCKFMYDPINSASNGSSFTCKWISFTFTEPSSALRSRLHNVCYWRECWRSKCASASFFQEIIHWGQHREQGSLIGGSSWRRILYSYRTHGFHSTFPSATSNSLSEKLFSLHKQGRHEHQCTSCDDKSIHLIHRLYDGVRSSRPRFRRITSHSMVQQWLCDLLD